MRLADEVFGDGVVEEGEEGVVETGDVQQAVGFAVKAELRPGEDFGEFLEGAEAAGQGDEGIRQLGHESLALVHGGDDAEVFESAVRNFFGNKGLGYDADDFATAGKHGVGDGSHQSDASTAVNEADSAAGEKGAHVPRGVGVRGLGAAIGAAINAKTFDGHAGKSGIPSVRRSMLQRRKGSRPHFAILNLNLPENERHWGQVGM